MKFSSILALLLTFLLRACTQPVPAGTGEEENGLSRGDRTYAPENIRVLLDRHSDNKLGALTPPCIETLSRKAAPSSSSG